MRQLIWQLFSAAANHRWPLLLLVLQNDSNDESGGLDFANAKAVADFWSGLGDVVQRLAALSSIFMVLRRRVPGYRGKSSVSFIFRHHIPLSTGQEASPVA